MQVGKYTSPMDPSWVWLAGFVNHQVASVFTAVSVVRLPRQLCLKTWDFRLCILGRTESRFLGFFGDEKDKSLYTSYKVGPYQL